VKRQLDEGEREYCRVEQKRHMMATKSRWCPDCHGYNGMHRTHCPNDPGECDETPEKTEEDEDE